MRTPEVKVETVTVPWAGRGSRFPLLYERFATEVLLACRSVSAAAELLGLSWDELQRIMERGVKRGLERRELEGLRHVGMDEKSFGRGQSYLSLLTDLDRARVLEVVKDAAGGGARRHERPLCRGGARRVAGGGAAA